VTSSASALEQLLRDLGVRIADLDRTSGHLGAVPTLLHIHILGHSAVVELDVASSDTIAGEGVRYSPPTVIFGSVNIFPENRNTTNERKVVIFSICADTSPPLSHISFLKHPVT